MIVDIALYRDGRRVETDCHPHEYTALQERAEPGDFIWLGLYAPSHTELSEVAEAFDLHPLAVEDAVTAHQRPKLERFGESLFMVLKTLWYVDADDQVETGEINLFVGANFVITVRHGRGVRLDDTRHSLEADPDRLSEGPSAVIWRVADTVVDGYLSVLAELQIDVDEVESSVFSSSRTSDAARIYTLKRELAEVRRAVHPLREPIRALATGAVPHVDPDIQPFFRDVLDHIGQAAETAEQLEAMLSSAFEAHLAQISVQQNDDMRKISAGAALVVVPTFIAGVYGMNFEHMPELDWSLGYPMALLIMAASVSGLWWFFKRSGWL
ncbi:magnesium/cobalt transporter CorA [Nocardioides sp. Kera G14]|uniref:magnesium/cobalt transporter CorA n=1 Tax=Nocardioides sp. Kera G14 TaxID=2884264 RepID=UPI001D106E80|nr:magnesium/cobalt transporter CorA [Nocardioides sp. Kera G14]UDY25172.1 magnesium/cobalt transporter CorA [Nocardioides sp. Kera G14]